MSLAALREEVARLRERDQRLEHAEQKLRAQRELVLALGASFDVAEASEHMLRAAFELEEIDCGGVYLVDRQSGDIELVHHRGLSEAFVQANAHYEAGSAHARIIQGKAPIFSHYAQLAPTMDEANEAEQLRAIAVIPVVYRGDVVAAFNLASHTEDEFAPSVRDDIISLAAQMGGVVFRVVVEDERKRLERQVQHGQKLESLGILAGGIAHDFNNLLMGVLGNASLALAQLPVESPARREVLDIERTAKRAAELVQQLLAYSGKGRFVVERVSPSAIVEEMVHLLEVSVSKNASLVLDLDPDAPSILADATQVRQVLVNLITNASEALGGRSGVVSIRTGATRCDRHYLRETCFDEDLGEGLYARIEVSDTGAGMDRRTMSRIFDPFFTTKFAGRGLGLAAVLGIVRSHRGTIEVRSEPGQGTCFTVLFPADTAESTAGRPRASDDTGLEAAGRCVLVVDDEEIVRQVAARMLDHLGFEVVSAADGHEALELFRATPERFAVVLLDLTMPRMGGEACLRELRAIRPDVRVILSSGHSEQDLVARRAGKDLAGVIQKPYEVVALKAVLRKALR
jgi:signal transduction histidine kinase